MKYDDEFEDELKPLLSEWRAPAVPAALNARVLASFQQQSVPRSRWAWLKAPLLVPWPVTAAAMVLLCAASWWTARRSFSPLGIAPPLAATTRFVEVPVVQEKVVTRVVYVTRPVTPIIKPEPSKLLRKNLPSDLAGFRPVNEIKLEISEGGQE